MKCNQSLLTIAALAVGALASPAKLPKQLVGVRAPSLTATAPSKCPTAVGWVAKGCYTDSVQNRTLTHNGWVTGGPDFVNVETCQAGCRLKNFKYAGVEYAGECYCDNTLHGKGAPAPDGNAGCNMPCKGDKSEICGGADRLNLYEFVIAPPGCPPPKPLVSSKSLRDTLKVSSLVSKAEILEGFAFAHPERNRVIGSHGHNSTVAWLFDTITGLSDYYTVYKQGFTQTAAIEEATSLTLNGVKAEAYAQGDAPPASDVTAPLWSVPNLACNPSDFAGFPKGAIALVFRGNCSRGDKVILSSQFGAVGTIMYNTGPEPLKASLPHDIEGTLVPTVAISLDAGKALVARLAAGEKITAVLNTAYRHFTTYNVIAETIAGDHDNVIHICGHSDSVTEGPGINDNGSGTISILEIAIQLTKFAVKNAVRFSWWTAEEEGLLGAEYYVSKLTQAEKDKQRLVLDFDMMASPNFAYQIYDGDGSAFGGKPSPPGSAEAEHEFAAYFDSQGLNHTEIEFDGRSDYGPFLEAGIASGGIACGAEGLKTAAEALMFGGQAGVAYDINYHGPGDNVANLNTTAWLVMTDAIAHMTAKYALSFESIPPRKRELSIESEAERRDPLQTVPTRRWLKASKRV